MPAFSSMFSSLLSGNFKEAADYAFIDQKTVDTLEANKSQLEQRIAQSQKEGLVSDDQAKKILSGISNTAFPDSYRLTGQRPSDVFTKGIKNDIGGALKFVAFSIPWQVWVVVALGAAVYFAPFIMPLAARYVGKGK